MRSVAARAVRCVFFTVSVHAAPARVSELAKASSSTEVPGILPSARWNRMKRNQVLPDFG